MLSQDEQAALFVDAINKDALKMCREIEKETKKFYSAETQKLEDAAKKQMERKLAYAEKDITTQLNRKAAENKATFRNEYYKIRENLTADIFSRAAYRLAEFTKTDEYPAFLEKSIKKISGILNGGFTLFVKKDDVDKAENAAKNIGVKCSVTESDSILIGGVRAESTQEKKIVDDTLDERLFEQREWFLSHVGSQLNI